MGWQRVKLSNFQFQTSSGLPQWLSGKESACNAGDEGEKSSIPGSGTSPGGGLGNLLQYSCLENPMDRGARWATVYRVAKSRTRLKQLSACTHTHTYTNLYLSEFEFSPAKCSGMGWRKDSK